MVELPHGTVTFLFTDIEGSTRLWQAHPDTMPAALARHDDILRRAIGGAGGVVFRTVGDAFHAAFPVPLGAVNAALSAQRALNDVDWGATPIKVRMGIHTGPVEVREGEYLGHTLNREARIVSAGHGGQILLSASTVELIRDALPSSVELLDHGERRLKDLVSPEHLFELTADDLPSAFPPLRVLDEVRTNLPTQSTVLIGREKEVAEVGAMLRQGRARLLTLTGPGGTGKTRVALQVAAELAGEFPDGVFFVALGTLRDASAVPAQVADAIGIRVEASQTAEDLVIAHCRRRRLLLVLDNFEHLPEATPFVARLLAACPGVQVLATSRSRLHISEERDYPIPTLRVPSHQPPDLDAVARYDAVGLFVDRARAVRPDFTLTEENAAAVVQICRRLDGLPLAIELAASRVRLFPPSALLRRLESRLQVLKGGALDRPERQQTLRGAMDWSHDLLTEPEKVLFRRLAVFPGGWTIEGAETVCNADGGLEIDVLDGLESLLDKSLIRPVPGANDEPRFGMLETIRAYALEKLAAAGEGEAMHRAQADFVAGFLDATLDEALGPEQEYWIVQLRGELDNFRAAVNWALSIGDAALTFRLLAKSFWTVYLDGNWGEAAEWYRRALALPGAEQRTLDRAWVLMGSGYVAGVTGQPDLARTLLDESAEIAREVGDREAESYAFSNLGWHAWHTGQYDLARDFHRRSLDLARQQDTPLVLMLALHAMGFVAAVDGDYSAARAYLEESIAVGRGHGGDRLGAGDVLNTLGDVARAEGDYEAAGRHYEQALRIMDRFLLLGNRASAVHNLGYVHLARGAPLEAAGYFRQALDLLSDLGDQRGVLECLGGLAATWTARGRPDIGARLFAAVDRLLGDMGARIYPTNQPDYDRYLAATRDRLPPDVFTREWESGRTLSSEDAVRLGMEGESAAGEGGTTWPAGAA